MLRFKVGDNVMARWPGTQLYFKAIVKKISDEDKTADVLYEDGTEMDVPFDHIRSEGAFRSGKKSKSPARRRSRSRSPARSPGRTTKTSPSRTRTRTSPSRSTRSTRNRTSNTSSSSTEDKPSSSPTRMTITKSQRFDKTDKESKEGYEKVTTRSYQAKITMEKVNADTSAQASGEADTMSSKLNEAKRTIENVKKSMQKRPKYEFGGPFGVLFQYLFVPFITIAIVASFGTKKSELLKMSLKDIPRDWRAYYDPTAAIIVVEFLLFQAVLYALPVGNIVQGPKTYSGKKTEYRMHAFHCLVITLLAFCGLQYMKLPVFLVHKKMLQMCATSVVLAFLFNFLLQFKSYSAPEDELNPRGNTGCTIYDTFVGRELHPKIGRYYHLKLLLYRPCMTAWILIDFIYLQKEFEQNQTIRPAVGILVGVQMIYCFFIYFWDEAQAFFSFDIKNEALGFTNLIGNLAIVPFIYTSPIRFLIDHPKVDLVQLPMLVTATVLMAVGLALVLLSVYQKTSFRQNPYDPSLSAIESIPPSKKGGSRLITSGYWGFVRHPNYLGEILLGIGFGLMCGFTDILPWVYVIFVAGLLVHRSLRLEERSRETHGYAWSEYCKRVPYRILPYVY